MSERKPHESVFACEAWRTIVGHDEYEISDQGRVRSWRRRGGGRRLEPKLLTPYRAKKPTNSERKYLCVALPLCDGTFVKSYVHRLVLETFVGQCPDGFECRHLDGNPENNHLINLRWGTALDNAGDRRRHGTVRAASGERHGSRTKPERVPRGERAKHVLTEQDVLELRASNESNSAAAIRFGISPMQVSRIRRRLQWRHVG